MTVLVLGIPSEPPVRAVVDALRRCGGDVFLWNQRQVLETSVQAGLTPAEPGGQPSLVGQLVSPDGVVDLASLEGIYMRLTDNGELPEVSGLAFDDPRREHADHVLDTMFSVCQLSPATVVNRPGARDENGSKPRQLQLIARHFATPPTLATNDPHAVVDFWREHGRVVYKSNSGERSIVTELTEADASRFGVLARCPAQFQALVEGVDIRVHAMSSGVTFATAIAADTIDYRYGEQSSMEPVELPGDVATACIRLTVELGLELSGLDFKLTPDGVWVCLEVNPSPAFTAFEHATGQPIAAAVARLLVGRNLGCGC
jgi:hypothetical protein